MICDDIFAQRFLNNPIKDVSSRSQSTVRIVLVQQQKGQLWSHLDLTRLTGARTRPVTAHHMLLHDRLGPTARNVTVIGCKCGHAG